MEMFERPLVFVDIETNGLSPRSARVIEVAAIRVEHGKVVQKLNTLVDAGTPVPAFTTQLTGITQADMRGAPAFAEIVDKLQTICQGAVFVAHNVQFDYSFLREEFAREGVDFAPQLFCTVKLSRALYPQERSHKLELLIKRHGLKFSARHRAYDDAHALWQFLQIAAKTFEPPVLAAAFARQLS